MKQSYSVDEVFKEQLSEIDFPQKEKMWKLMEEKLQKDAAAGKRRKWMAFSTLALVLCLIIPALKLGDKLLQKNTSTAEQKNEIVASTDNQPLKSNSTAGNNNTLADNLNNTTSISSIVSIPQDKNVPADDGYSNTNRLNGSTKTRTRATIIAPSVFVDEVNQQEVNNNPYTKYIGQFDLLASLYPSGNNKLLTNRFPVINNKTVNTTEKNTRTSNKKSPFAIEAGVDLLRKKQDIGFYAGATVEKVINPQISLTAGLNFSKNALSQSYSIANKVPPYDKVIDANLHSMTMLRMPVMYNQKLTGSRITAKAGLTPVYILNANITNVPNSYVGNPADYRKFTIDDIHRFNLLFSAGVNYKISPRFSAEIIGHFGLTDQVKDKFVNQSNVNDNMKSVQAGVVYKFK